MSAPQAERVPRLVASLRITSLDGPTPESRISLVLIDELSGTSERPIGVLQGMCSHRMDESQRITCWWMGDEATTTLRIVEHSFVVEGQLSHVEQIEEERVLGLLSPSGSSPSIETAH